MVGIAAILSLFLLTIDAFFPSPPLLGLDKYFSTDGRSTKVKRNCVEVLM